MGIRETTAPLVCGDHATYEPAGDSAGCVGQVARLIHAPDLIRGQARDIGKKAGQRLAPLAFRDGCPVNGKRSAIAIAAVE